MKRGNGWTKGWFPSGRTGLALSLASLFLLNSCGGKGFFQKTSVVPRTLRDVPVERLAYTFQPDVTPPPDTSPQDDVTLKAPEIQAEFDRNRINDALLRTVPSPDKQRVLAIYAPADTPEGEFRIDLYGNAGNLIHLVTPEGLSGAFIPTVAWSPDGNYISFIGRRAVPPPVKPVTTGPDDLGPLPPGITPTPLPPPPPIVPAYATEQIYVCTRDGTDLKPLTRRPGLIYFYYAWSPDSHSLAAQACLEREWNAREADGLGQLPAGRPRLISLTGKERLLDDKLSEVQPVWCPDSSKIAAAYEYDIKLYDAVGDKPGQAAIHLHDLLLAASRDFDAKKAGGNVGDTSGDPVSLYPAATLQWPDSKTLYLRTGYVPTSETDRPVNVFSRWHTVQLGPQAALLN